MGLKVIGLSSKQREDDSVFIFVFSSAITSEAICL
jgi:hypothetical protein